MPSVVILVPVFNRLKFTQQFLADLRKNTFLNWSLLVIDDGSSDGTAEWLAQEGRLLSEYSDVEFNAGEVYYMRGDGEWWWTKCINTALKVALKNGAELILTHNNDVELPKNYLAEIVAVQRTHPNAIVTAPIYDMETRECLPDGAGVLRDWWWAKDIKLAHPKAVSECGGVKTEQSIRRLGHCSGRGCLVPKTVFEKVGLYDQKHLPHYAADDDFTFRAANQGVSILMAMGTVCYTPARETGLTGFIGKRCVKGFLGYLTSQKSPANIYRRFWITYRHCRPRWYMPISLLLDISRVCVSYFIQTRKRNAQ